MSASAMVKFFSEGLGLQGPGSGLSDLSRPTEVITMVCHHESSGRSVIWLDSMSSGYTLSIDR
jgi:hypothetical protein